MWLSEQAASRAGNGGGAAARVGSVTIGGKSAAVLLTGEYRGLGVLAPRGVAWRPGTGAQVLVIETDDGERFIAGTVDGENEAADGELCLGAGSAKLRFGADQKICAEGELRLTGDLYLTGRLFLNGVEIKAEETV